jgi:hypothetical protein
MSEQYWKQRAYALERALSQLEDAVHTQRIRGNGVDQEVLAAQITARDLLTNQPADAGEPDEPELTINKQPQSCCARTREKCAQVADYYASEHKQCGEETTSDDLKRTHTELEDVAENIAAVIRLIGDTP